MAKTGRNKRTCSFCGNEESNQLLLLDGIDAHICENCVQTANNILRKIHNDYKNNIVETTLPKTFTLDFSFILFNI